MEVEPRHLGHGPAQVRMSAATPTTVQVPVLASYRVHDFHVEGAVLLSYIKLSLRFTYIYFYELTVFVRLICPQKSWQVVLLNID